MLKKFAQIDGFTVRAIKAGMKKSGNPDLGIIYTDQPVAVAGVFTQNLAAAAPVVLNRAALKKNHGRARALIVNAGCANACTGAFGISNAKKCAAQIAKKLNCSTAEILMFSTGVIGVQLDLPKMTAGIARLLAGEGAGDDFSQAIMTTDTQEKTASITLKNGVQIAGTCKGAGMIAPNMATLLAFILTDAQIAPNKLQDALRAAADASFNQVSIDGDTSTNDSFVAMASGTGAKIDDRNYAEFCEGLLTVSQSLAEQIARDGEGATKLVRIILNGAKNLTDARRAARAVGESPLVKTAMFGNDPNWGRIICALGYSGVNFSPLKTTIALCGKTIFRNGTPQKFAATALSQKMRTKEVVIAIDLGAGKSATEFLTCDFSYDYVKINAEYTT